MEPGNRDDNGEDAEGNYKGRIGGIARIGHDKDGSNGSADPNYA